VRLRPSHEQLVSALQPRVSVWRCPHGTPTHLPASVQLQNVGCACAAHAAAVKRSAQPDTQPPKVDLHIGSALHPTTVCCLHVRAAQVGGDAVALRKHRPGCAVQPAGVR
jgi:hypothetical protein